MTTQFTLSQHHDATLRGLINSQPHIEICGLVGGVWQPYPHCAIAHSVTPIRNCNPQPTVRYTLDPTEQIAAMLAFEKKGWEVVAVYHSHPTGLARPSPTDLAEWTLSDALMLIGVPRGDLAAWRIVNGAAQAVEICLI